MKLKIVVGFLLVVIVALGMAAYQTIRWAERPAVPPNQHPSSKVVVILDGSTFQQVATLLDREGLIRSRFAFLLFGKWQSADRKIYAGEYELNAGMTPVEILAKLLSGQVVLHSLTIPEGLSTTQIATLLTQQGIAERDEFLRLTQDKAF